MSDNFGEVFQNNTKYYRDRSFGHPLSWMSKPDTYKQYKTKSVPLIVESNKNYSFAQLNELLKHRRSVRNFTNIPIALSELSTILWASTGIREKENGYAFRTAPSAGALYPIETYVVANDVTDLTCGLYHYDIKENALEELKTGSFGNEVAHAALDQNMCAEAPALFIWTAIFLRSKWKYRQRAYRYIYLDAGHIAQNLALSAVSLGLGSCQIGAFYDEELNDILEVDGIEESSVYLSVVGHPS